MQSDPSRRPAAPGVSPEALTDAARGAMRNLVVDGITVRVVGELEGAGVGVVVLKGPSVARWLYVPGERTYADIDLLIRPGDEKIAAGILGGLGYRTHAPPVLPLDRPSYQEWELDPVSPPIDLHPTLNLLEQLPPELVWAVVSAETERLTLQSGSIPVLNEGARALHVALHALAHDSGSVQASADLERAVASLPDTTWRHAARVADRLGAGAILSEALRTTSAGVSLAERLGLTHQPVVSVIVRRRGGGAEQAAALAVDWWWSLTRSERVRLLGRKMFPSPDYLRARSRFARRGTLGMVTAYAMRPFVILGWGIKGAVTWMKARKTGR